MTRIFRVSKSSCRNCAQSFARADSRTTGLAIRRATFFKPIEALFVDRSPEARQLRSDIARISRSPSGNGSTTICCPRWRAIYCEAMKHAILVDDKHEIKLIVTGFQSKVVKCLEGFLASEQGVADVRNGLGKYTGLPSQFGRPEENSVGPATCGTQWSPLTMGCHPR